MPKKDKYIKQGWDNPKAKNEPVGLTPTMFIKRGNSRGHLTVYTTIPNLDIVTTLKSRAENIRVEYVSVDMMRRLVSEIPVIRRLPYAS